MLFLHTVYQPARLSWSAVVVAGHVHRRSDGVWHDQGEAARSLPYCHGQDHTVHVHRDDTSHRTDCLSGPSCRYNATGIHYYIDLPWGSQEALWYVLILQRVFLCPKVLTGQFFKSGRGLKYQTLNLKGKTRRFCHNTNHFTVLCGYFLTTHVGQCKIILCLGLLTIRFECQQLCFF